ncbi:MAG: hypothetical protein WEB60_14095 [Terrimicrobiaceae bacterium]
MRDVIPPEKSGHNSSPPPRSKILHFLHGANRHLAFWVVIFLVLVGVGLQVPGWIKWLPFLGAFGAGLRAFGLLAAGMEGFLTWGMANLEAGEAHVRKITRPDWGGWRLILGGCAAVLLALAIWQAWPSWVFLATSSLREDEILNIEQYTSRGFAKPASSYSLARNHIFYNVVNSILPGSASTWPPRARLLSFLSVGAGLGLLVGYGWRRGWLIPGIFFAGLVAGNHFAMKTLLEARGYGMIFFFGVLASVAFAEWARTKSSRWLGVLAAAVVAGTYTLPYFLVFGAGLLVLAWLAKPSKQTFGAGLVAAVAILMLYLPLAADVLKVATGYGKAYAESTTYNFTSIESVMRIFQFLVSYDLAHFGPPVIVIALLGILAFVTAAAFAPHWARLAVGGVATGVVAVAAFFLVIGAVPIRTAAFLGGPQAFLALVLAGSVMGARVFRSVKPVLHAGFAVFAAVILFQLSAGEPLVPRQNWKAIGLFVERAFPEETRLWAPKNYGKLVQWNLKDRRTLESGKKDAAAFQQGKLVTIDAEFNAWAEERRPGRAEFPGDVRFVTFPLLINYHRVYFMPPRPAGVISVTAGGVSLPPAVAGVQVPDPGVLSQTGGHGDTLARQGIPAEATIASPPTIPLPTTLVVRLEPTADAGVCNFLFTRHVEDLQIRSAWQNANGVWKDIKSDFRSGEFISVKIPPGGCHAVRLEISEKQAPAKATPFGLLNVWLN